LVVDELNVDLNSPVILPLALFKARHPGKYGNDISVNINMEVDHNKRRVARTGRVYTSTTTVKTKDELLCVSVVYGDLLSVLNVQNYAMISYPFELNIKLFMAVLGEFTTSIPALPKHQNFTLTKDGISGLVFELENQLSAYNPFKDVNAVAFRDLDGSPYENVVYATPYDSYIHLTSEIKLQGGSNGDVHKTEVYHGLLKSLYSGVLVPEVLDPVRYPINHIVDLGYPMDVKLSMIDLSSMVDTIIPSLSTHINRNITDVYGEARYGIKLDFTGEIVGDLLLQRSQSFYESMKYHTKVSTPIIYGGYGLVSSTNEERPLSWVMAVEIAKLDGGVVISSRLPNTFNNRFDTYPIGPSSSTAKELYQQGRINHVYHRPGGGYILPGLMTTYPDQDSVLSDGDTVRHLNYIKQLLHRVWATYSGVLLSDRTVLSKMSTDLSFEVDRVFNGLYRANATATDTAVLIEVYSRPGMKILSYEYNGFMASVS